MSCAYDIALYIAQTLAKGTLGTDVFVNYMPDLPVNCITVYEYGGMQSARGMGSDTGALEHPNVQVNVRNSDASQAASIAKSIHNSFDQIGTATTINSTVYTWFNPLSPPFILERIAGPNGTKTTFVFNMEVQNRR